MKSLHSLRSTAMLMAIASAGVACAAAPLERAHADTTDIHDIFSPTVRKLAQGCHCEGGFMAFEPSLTICIADGGVTTAHSGCY